eukprot:TRINITY_DN12382_c0_g2_i1.p1 TRINITY_DN12382_c0_g2~~TRINITY_DN12382_c0_g2_i1.p1  ORF type:complete len:348 (-),score=60.83 TRINITY_DN12382_c0_g2_i1:394-1383(-)
MSEKELLALQQKRAKKLAEQTALTEQLNQKLTRQQQVSEAAIRVLETPQPLEENVLNHKPRTNREEAKKMKEEIKRNDPHDDYLQQTFSRHPLSVKVSLDTSITSSVNSLSEWFERYGRPQNQTRSSQASPSSPSALSSSTSSFSSTSPIPSSLSPSRSNSRTSKFSRTAPRSPSKPLSSTLSSTTSTSSPLRFSKSDVFRLIGPQSEDEECSDLVQQIEEIGRELKELERQIAACNTTTISPSKSRTLSRSLPRAPRSPAAFQPSHDMDISTWFETYGRPDPKHNCALPGFNHEVYQAKSSTLRPGNTHNHSSTSSPSKSRTLTLPRV